MSYGHRLIVVGRPAALYSRDLGAWCTGNGSDGGSGHTGAVGQQPPKYARVERERRFLVKRLPPWSPEAERRITDRYLDGSRLRLRTVDDLGPEPGPPVFKLTQKVSSPDPASGDRGHLTTIYLNEAEHRLVGRLPGVTLTKRRLTYPPMAVDVFDGPGLDGLLIAEVEFESDAAMAWFTVPSWCGPEITGEPGWSGADLAVLAAAPPDTARRTLDALRRRHPAT